MQTPALNARVVRIDSVIEEEVDLEIASQQIEVFADVCPDVIVEGQTCRVRLDLVVIDDDKDSPLRIGSSRRESITALGGGRYLIRGILREGAILESCSIFFDVSDLTDDVRPIHSGSPVEVWADRISAEFLRRKILPKENPSRGNLSRVMREKS